MTKDTCTSYFLISFSFRIKLYITCLLEKKKRKMILIHFANIELHTLMYKDKETERANGLLTNY